LLLTGDAFFVFNWSGIYQGFTMLKQSFAQDDIDTASLNQDELTDASLDGIVGGSVWAMLQKLGPGNVPRGIGSINGGSGNDHLMGTFLSDNMSGGAGDDVMSGGLGNDTLNGGTGNDILNGGAGNDTLIGGSGTDTASYADAQAGVTVNLATGTATDGMGGIDRLSEIENIIGGTGHDQITGDRNSNTLSGGAGNDIFNGGAGNDTLIGGSGTDTASYADAQAGVTVNLATGTATDSMGGIDRLSEIENIIGGTGHDQITGDRNSNTLSGEAGNDTLNGGAGNDTLLGGSGTDTASYADAQAGVTVNLATGTATDGMGGIDRLSEIENITGGTGHDQITGDQNSNTLSGGAGNDTLDGGAGNDTLDGGIGNDLLVGGEGNDTVIGGAGSDTLTGGAGSDTFVINSLDGSDTITDFGRGDVLKIDKAGLSGVTNFKLVATRDGNTLVQAEVSGSFRTIATLNDVKGSELRVEQGADGPEIKYVGSEGTVSGKPEASAAGKSEAAAAVKSDANGASTLLVTASANAETKSTASGGSQSASVELTVGDVTVKSSGSHAYGTFTGEGGGTQMGVQGNVTSLEVSTDPNKTVSGGVRVASGGYEASVGGDGAKVGASANVAEVFGKVGSLDKNNSNDTVVGGGVSVGVGAGGAVHWSDADGDGQREYGFSIEAGPISVTVKTESPNQPIKAVGGAVKGAAESYGSTVVDASKDLGSSVAEDSKEFGSSVAQDAKTYATAVAGGNATEAHAKAFGDSVTSKTETFVHNSSAKVSSYINMISQPIIEPAVRTFQPVVSAAKSVLSWFRR
jgi:Ca2+-binding RTX toxin-like protein